MGLSVMQAILSLERAGAQQVVKTLSEHLRKRDCDVIVCAFQDGPMRAEIEQLGIPVFVLDRPRYSVALLPLFIAELLRIRRQMAHLIKTYHVDIIQTHILQVLDFLALSLRGTANLRAVLWTMQDVEFLPKRMPHGGHWFQRLKRRGYLWLYRLLASRVDGFIAVSDQVREAIIRQVGPVQTKIHTICNAVDTKRFDRRGDRETLCRQLGIDGNASLVATVGRLTEQKGHRYLIDAASAVANSLPSTHFLLIGRGELENALRRQATETKAAGNIHFLGVRDDVPDLLAAVDLFVLPSLWEGLSVALLEAMAAGKPIVATQVSGTTQVIAPGVTGLIVPPRDSNALAAAITAVLSKPEQAQAMGQAAKQHVEANFGAQSQADAHLALYRSFLDR